MSEPTTGDIIVTSYVNQNYSGSYETRSSGGYTYREYDNARGDFWFDNNRDGFFEYGRRDEGQGEWSTFEGFFWDDTAPPPPRFESEEPEVVQGRFTETELASEIADDLFAGKQAYHEGDINFAQPGFMSVEDGWFL